SRNESANAPRDRPPRQKRRRGRLSDAGTGYPAHEAREPDARGKRLLHIPFVSTGLRTLRQSSGLSRLASAGGPGRVAEPKSVRSSSVGQAHDVAHGEFFGITGTT